MKRIKFINPKSLAMYSLSTVHVFLLNQSFSFYKSTDADMILTKNNVMLFRLNNFYVVYTVMTLLWFIYFIYKGCFDPENSMTFLKLSSDWLIFFVQNCQVVLFAVHLCVSAACGPEPLSRESQAALDLERERELFQFQSVLCHTSWSEWFRGE